MNTFEASNGTRIDATDYGSWKALHVRTVDNDTHLAGVHVDALREFFLHERDEQLGRWRWPENPDYVVYPVAREHAVVWDERLRELWHVHLDIAQAESVGQARTAFRAYLAAHPEPKPRPWATARVITWRNGAYLPQIAQRDLDYADLGWRVVESDDPRWLTEDALAALIGDADVTILEPAS